MRHEAAGITTAAFPKTIRLGGVDCAAELSARARPPARRRHRDGADLRPQPGERGTLRVARPGHAEGEGGRAREDLAATTALAPRAAARVRRRRSSPRPGFGEGSLLDALAAARAKRTGLPLRRADFKHEQLPPHLLMNLRVVDEHGRQLGESRHLAELKASLGAQARSAFQALAALRLPTQASRAAPTRRRRAGDAPLAERSEPPMRATADVAGTPQHRRPPRRLHRMDLRRAARADGAAQGRPDAGRLSRR